MKLLLTLVLGIAPLVFGAADSSAQSTTASAPRAAIIAQNEGTEITDLLVPFAVLSDAGIEVEVIATSPGPVTLWPAYELHDLTEMDDVNPADFDLLIIPAVLEADAPELLAFVKDFAGTGGLTASICDGVNVLAAASLLDGKQATGHFYSHDKRTGDFPSVNWVQDRRYVQDQRILSSAGVSASAPISVYVIEQMLGEAAAERSAQRFGINPDPEHSTDQFKFGVGDGLTMLGNGLRGIGKRNYAIVGEAGIDEYSLAFTADVLGRTSRVRLGLASESGRITTRHGLTLSGPVMSDIDTQVVLPGSERKAGLLYETELLIESADSATVELLNHTSLRFGDRTAKFIAKQLEMPLPAGLARP